MPPEGRQGSSFTEVTTLADDPDATIFGLKDGDNIRISPTNLADDMGVGYTDADVADYLTSRPAVTGLQGTDMLTVVRAGNVVNLPAVALSSGVVLAYVCKPATAVSATSATLSGVTTNANVTAARFVLSPAHGSAPNDTTATVSGTDRTFSTIVTGLTPGVAYTYQVEFLNAAGVVQGTGSGCAFSTVQPDLGFTVTMDPNTVNTGGPPAGWLFETSNPADTITDVGARVRSVVGGFTAATHYARVRRRFGLDDQFIARPSPTTSGRWVLDVTIELPADFYTQLESYMRWVTVDNFPATISGTTWGALNSREWRVGFLTYGADHLPRLVSNHDGGEEIVLWVGTTPLAAGTTHTISIDFTPSTGTTGAAKLTIDGTTVLNVGNIHTAPNTLTAPEVAMTGVAAGIDDALVQHTKILTDYVHWLRFSAVVPPPVDQPPVANASPIALTDNFADGTPGSTWIDTPAGGTIQEVGSTVRLGVSAGVSGAPHRTSVARQNLKDHYYTIRLDDMGDVAPGGGGGGGAGTTPVSDDFNHADGAPPGWTGVAGQWLIEDGKLVHAVESPDSGLKWNLSAGSPNQQAVVTYLSSGNDGHHHNIWLRGNATTMTPADGTFYGVTWSGGGATIQFFKYVAGSGSTLATLPATDLSDNVAWEMKFTVVNNLAGNPVLSFYINGALHGTAYTDSSSPITSGNYGALGAFGTPEYFLNWTFGPYALDPSFTETFTGTNGTQPSGWTFLVPTGAAANIQSNALNLAPVSGKSVMAVKTGPDAYNFTMTLEVTHSVALTRYFYVWLRATNDASVNGTPALVLPDDGYFIGVEHTGPTDRYALNKRLNGTDTPELDTFDFTATTAPINIKVQALDGLIRAKIWTGVTEPDTWSLTYTDGSPLPAGKVALHKEYDSTNPGAVSVNSVTLAVGGETAPGVADLYWGAWMEGPDTYGFYYGGTWDTAPWGAATMNLFESHAGKKVSIVHYGQPAPWLPNAPFYPDTADKITVRGAIPMMDLDVGSTSLSALAAGTYDAAIDSWATAVKAWGKPFFLRPMWEINAPFFSWGVQARANPATYIAAWRRLKDRCDAIGATNITWVWCVNIIDSVANTSIPSLWPGDSYVDWIGIDGYNWGDTSKGPWKTFDEIFEETYDALIAVNATKPMVICEIASEEATNSPGTESKALWIADMFDQLTDGSYPNIEAFVWFNWRVNENGIWWPWPIETSAAAQTAFAAGVADTKFAGALTALTPLTKVPRLQASNPVADDDWTVYPTVVYPGDSGLFANGHFIIGVDVQDPTLFDDWTARGITTVVRVPGNADGSPISDAKIMAWRDAANAAGLWEIRQGLSNLSLETTDARLIAITQEDEPEAVGNQIGYEVIQARYNAIKAALPGVPVFLNLIGHLDQVGVGNHAGEGGDTWYAQYVLGTDWLSADVYPINDGHALTEFPAMVDHLRTLAGSKPVFAYIECSDIGPGGGGAPSAGEMRAQIWAAIVHGARGIIYFPISQISGWDFDAVPSDLVTEMTTQNARISAISAVLQGPINPAGMSATGASPLHLAWRNSPTEGQYVIALNYSNTTLTNVAVTVTGVTGTVEVVGESRNEVISTGVITDTFTPYQVHVYRKPPAVEDPRFIRAALYGATDSMQIEVADAAGDIQVYGSRPFVAADAHYFRPSELNNVTKFEYGPDGVTWTPWTSFPTPFDVTSSVVEIGVEASSPMSAHTAVLSRFNNPPAAPDPPPPPPDPDPGGDPPPPPPSSGTFTIPTSPSQVGPTVGRVTNQATTLVPGITYTGQNFVNVITSIGPGAYYLVDCEVRLSISGYATNRTIYMDRCYGFVFFSDGAQTGVRWDRSHLTLPIVSLRPEGHPQNNVTVSTPMQVNGCWVAAAGPISGGSPGNYPHSEAMQSLGGNGMSFTYTRFNVDPRLNPDGTTYNTAAVSMLAANCLFDHCDFGIAGATGSPFYMVYSGHDVSMVNGKNNFNSCRVVLANGTTRALVFADCYPANNNRPIIDGAPMP